MLPSLPISRCQSTRCVSADTDELMYWCIAKFVIRRRRRIWIFRGVPFQLSVVNINILFLITQIRLHIVCNMVVCLYFYHCPPLRIGLFCKCLSWMFISVQRCIYKISFVSFSFVDMFVYMHVLSKGSSEWPQSLCFLHGPQTFLH